MRKFTSSRRHQSSAGMLPKTESVYGSQSIPVIEEMRNELPISYDQDMKITREFEDSQAVPDEQKTRGADPN